MKWNSAVCFVGREPWKSIALSKLQTRSWPWGGLPQHREKNSLSFSYRPSEKEGLLEQIMDLPCPESCCWQGCIHSVTSPQSSPSFQRCAALKAEEIFSHLITLDRFFSQQPSLLHDLCHQVTLLPCLRVLLDYLGSPIKAAPYCWLSLFLPFVSVIILLYLSTEMMISYICLLQDYNFTPEWHILDGVT